MQHNNILKEIGVLLIAAIMGSTSAVAINTNDASPEFMVTGAQDLSSLQQTNVFDPDYIHFVDGTTVSAVGLANEGTFEGAIRITPAELGSYDGYELTAVRQHHGSNSSPSHSGTIKIYGAGTSTNPGSLITSEPFTIPFAGWFEINLSNPVPINATKDVWVSVQVTHVAGEFPIGVAPGPVVPEKGGWIGQDGVEWFQFGIDIPTLNYNWNIQPKVEESSSEKPERPSGPTEGLVGVKYTFTTHTMDLDSDQVYYKWDWDDENSSEWLGPFNSEVTVSGHRVWREAEEYNIQVKTKDLHGKKTTSEIPQHHYAEKPGVIYYFVFQHYITVFPRLSVIFNTIFDR